MKIVQIIDNYPPNHHGGAETSCKLISRRLNKIGHEVVVITNGSSEDTVTKTEEGIKIIEISKDELALDWKDAKKNYFFLKEKINRINPDIIHIHLFEKNFKGALYLAREFRVIYTAHNYTLLLPNHLRMHYFLNNPKDLFSPQILSFLKHIIKGDIDMINESISDNIAQIKSIIAPSYFMKKYMEEHHLSNENITCVHNGVEIPLKNKISPRYNDPETLIFLGRIEKDKGVKYLIQAFRILKKRNKYQKLVLIGSGSYADKIKKEKGLYMIGMLKVVELTKFNGILILPSIWNENCSMSIIEAMAAGKVVVATDVGGNRELIQDLFNGMIIRKKDSNAIVQKIIALEKFPGVREYMATNAKLYAMQYLSIENNVSNLENVYKTILADNQVDYKRILQ